MCRLWSIKRLDTKSGKLSTDTNRWKCKSGCTVQLRRPVRDTETVVYKRTNVSAMPDFHVLQVNISLMWDYCVKVYVICFRWGFPWLEQVHSDKPMQSWLVNDCWRYWTITDGKCHPLTDFPKVYQTNPRYKFQFYCPILDFDDTFQIFLETTIHDKSNWKLFKNEYHMYPQKHCQL